MRPRIVVITCGLFFLFSLLLVKYYHIQVIQHEKWKHLAARQHELVVPQIAKRGRFFAKPAFSDPIPLVYDVTKFHLFADPQSIPKELKNEVAKAIIEHIEKEETIEKELEKSSRSRRLVSWLSREQKESLQKWWFPFAKRHKIPKNALFFVRDYQRSYPHGALLGQVLHTIREQKEETTHRAVPTGGLESYFHSILSGREGKRILLRSPLNKLEMDHTVVQAEDGGDLYLTIDPYLQAIMEEELEIGVKQAKAKGGWAFLMEAHSGEILASGQYPLFPPGQYKEFFNDPQKIELTKVHGITDTFEVGSIMKPLTVAIALTANETLEKKGEPALFDPNAPIDVTRAYFPGRGKRPIKDLPPHRKLNLEMAIQKSSNIYMAQLVDRIIQRLGANWYREQLLEIFGFGQKTGIELPAESGGVLPTPGSYSANGRPQWSVATPYSLSFGYNLQATALQMLRAFAALANGGKLVKPTLIKKILKNQEVIFQKREESFPRVLSKNTALKVVKAMKFSTKKGGTGHRAEVPGYTEAGKTGTAEKIVGGSYSNKIHISSFVGMAPVDLSFTKKSYVLIVCIDEAAPVLSESGVKNYMGGFCAAPVFKRIMQRSLIYLRVPQDDPFGWPEKDPRYDPKRADYAEDVVELGNLYQKWNHT